MIAATAPLSKAKEASAKANARTVKISAQMYATDNGGLYPPAVNLAFCTVVAQLVSSIGVAQF